MNIANANVYGLSTDLGLAGTEYNTALVIFFVPYILFEIPSNLLLKRLKPHVWRKSYKVDVPPEQSLMINCLVSACMFLFGVCTICQGLVHNYAGILAVRFFLGVFETGMFPGCFYLVSNNFRRLHE